jgi:hypothetical protein
LLKTREKLKGLSIPGISREIDFLPRYIMLMKLVFGIIIFLEFPESVIDQLLEKSIRKEIKDVILAP